MRKIACKDFMVGHAFDFAFCIAFNGDIRVVKNFFHKPLYKRRARTGIEQN